MLEAKELSVTLYILSQENNLYILQVVVLLFISELFPLLLFKVKKKAKNKTFMVQNVHQCKIIKL